MLDWNAIVMQQEHIKDLLREAEQERLVRPAGLRMLSRLFDNLRGWIAAQSAPRPRLNTAINARSSTLAAANR